MQYFLGLDTFDPRPLFSSTLFVELRKKLGKSTFDDFTDVLIQVCFSKKIKGQSHGELPNKGKLKLDATVADRYITYPTDLGVLNDVGKKQRHTEMYCLST